MPLFKRLPFPCPPPDLRRMPIPLPSFSMDSLSDSFLHLPNPQPVNFPSFSGPVPFNRGMYLIFMVQ
jgi:hypothetical protein